ncbi:MAG: amidohydrolase family protein, partial [Bacilli bacterium]
PDGDYELGGQAVFLRNRAARLEDGTLAGSVLRMDEAFRNIMTFTGCSVHEAVLMTSVNQAKEFGLTSKGGIHPGKDADFLMMDENYMLHVTFAQGRKVAVQ